MTLALPKPSSLASLIALGAASAAIYLFATVRYPITSLYVRLIDIGQLTSYSGTAAAGYVAVIVALFLLYFGAVQVVRRLEPRRALRVVLLFALVFGITLVFLYPIWAIDIYIYALYGRIWAHYGVNPMLVPISVFQGDPFLPFADGWAERVSAYGPLWVMVSGLFQGIAGESILGNLLLYKLTALGSYLGCVGLVAALLRRVRPGSEAVGALFVAWNPTVLLEVVGHGHNDATMTLFVLAAAALLLTRRRALSLPAVSLAILTKYTLGVLGPLFLVQLIRRKAPWSARLGEVAAGGLLSLALLIEVFAPFWAGLDTLRGVLEDSRLVFGSVDAAILCQSGQGIVPRLSQDTIQRGLIALFVVIYVVQLVRLLRDQSYLYTAAFEVTFWLVLVLPHFQSWYLVWPIALAAVAGRAHALWRIGVFSFATLFGGYVFGYFWVWQMPKGISSCQIQYVAAPIILLPPLAVSAAFGAAWLYRRARGGKPVARA